MSHNPYFFLNAVKSLFLLFISKNSFRFSIHYPVTKTLALSTSPYGTIPVNRVNSHIPRECDLRAIEINLQSAPQVLQEWLQGQVDVQDQSS